ISWVGLRGAVPIILATYPLLAGLSQADEIFNIVFFVVLTSAMLQGTTIPIVAKWLGVDEIAAPKPAYPIEFNPVRGFKNELQEITIEPNSVADGKSIVELGLPQDLLIILIARANEFLVPSGGVTLQAKDTLIVLSDKETFAKTERQLNQPHIPE
ncbi:MAG: potassium/proton antiporter, partial [Flavobacteriales bacterium]|nr:potassium/proton antiporter [Flavobacteriales bacterium]